MTQIINLFAGPGAGKSTIAAGLFSTMKAAGCNVELVTEFAKDIVWGEHHKAFGCQPYIFGEAYWRIYRLINQVEYVITDSPLIMQLVYCPEELPESFKVAIEDIFKMHDNINFYIERGRRAYNPKGRNQTYEEALQKDQEVLEILKEKALDYIKVPPEKPGQKLIMEYIIREHSSKQP